MDKRGAKTPEEFGWQGLNPSRFNSYNFDAGLDFDYTTGSKHLLLARLFEQKFCELIEHLNLAFRLKASADGSIVSTIAAAFVWKKN